jgi:hypothetical protein
MLDELHKLGSIVRYTVDKRSLIEISSFLTYQKPHVREAESVIPGISEGKKHRLGNGEAQPRQPVSDPKTVTVTVSKRVMQPAPSAPAVRPPTPAQFVLEHWARVRNKPPVFDRSDYAVVTKALGFFSIEQLKQAVDGIANDPWAERATQDSPGQIFGSAANVRKFIGLAIAGPPKPKVDVRRGVQRAEDQGWENVG